MVTQTDVIIVGAGLAGLVAAVEIANQGKHVIIVDQESEQNIGGQAFWSLGGLFLVDSAEQRRLGIHDTYELALQDWMGNAGFNRTQDYWPQRWAEAYVSFAAGEKRSWLYQQGIRFFPIVGWAERGGYGAVGPGNSVPRFHTTWGTGPGLLAPFIQRTYDAVKKGLIQLNFRCKVRTLLSSAEGINGIEGDILEPDPVKRGGKSARIVIGSFTFKAQAVIVTSGGVGGNLELVRANWPDSLGGPPSHMLSGVPNYVDGSMLAITEAAGGSIINLDRMWHYTEGIKNWNSIWSNHGIRILPGPSPLWIDAKGKRLPVPLFPGFDNLGTLQHIMQTGYDYSWFILTQKIIKKEFALSGSEQNSDLTNKRWRQTLNRAFGRSATPEVEAFKKHGVDFIVRNNLADLVEGMNAITCSPMINFSSLQSEIASRDGQINNGFCKDMQITAINGARKYIGDRLIRVAKPHEFLNSKAGPLIAVRLNIMTRKTLGGIQTDLSGRVLDASGNPVPGLYAAGEVAGFGGGGMHGYRALEGTFLGGCIFSGRTAGRAAGKSVI